jgi:hypothetical protein
MGVAKMKPAMSIGDGRYQDRLLAIEAAVPGHVIDSTADQAAKRRARQELSDPFLRDWMEGRKI